MMFNPNDYELRYSISGTGRTAKTCSHAVDRSTKKTLCGRDASDWFPMDGDHYPECERCKKKLGEVNYESS